MLLSLFNKTSFKNGCSIFRGRLVCGMVAAIFLITGCGMVGPDFVKPEAPVETEWLEARDPEIKTAPSDYKAWWSAFHDPVLDSLVEIAYQQNLPLQISGIRILQARAQLGVIVGNIYPQQQQARGGANYNRISENAPNSIGADDSFWQYDAGFDVAWELDVWGKFRRAIESGVANLEASIADYDDVLISLTAEVARTYVLLRTFEERLEIARENVKIRPNRC